ncbi:deoxyguanosinetriphosphate triphosphohydrolase [[Actinobacillus] muris]|uniref:Deoxyguanosinetriphosphate triphosphohydrolase n=1 Tax=Muribacter muris TaxID=67855 RepID=A0A0J5S221_9PAST|nr:LrgB family protein [Muribacter muris]KMK50872.1 deoxyguanosinetriphosphate triphosphohydrolase [[Actinobacillus] muris] [Muribacter muris]
MNVPIYAYSLLTVAVFIVALKLSKTLKSAVLNPFILSLLLLAAILVLCHIPFGDYYQGNFPINQLLGVSVVALAVPFYEQLPQIRKHWRVITIVVLAGSLFSMLTGVLLALLFGASQEIIMAILPKSVTTAIAVSIVDQIGGNSAVGAVAVTVSGLTGSAFGIAVLQWLKVHNARAVGLSMGAVSHALGTARSMEYSVKAGSYASVSLVLCGLVSSLLAPLLFKWVICGWF